MLKGKTVLLGVTGGIAAYKAAALASALEVCGCILVLFLSLPLFGAVLELIEELMRA